MLFNYSLAATSVASNTVLSSTSSVWTLISSRLILNHQFTFLKVCAVVLSVGGSCMIAFADGENNGNKHSVIGDIIALVSAIFYALYTTVLKWCLPDERRYSMGMVFGFVGILNLSLLWPLLAFVDFIGVEPFEWPSLNILWPMAINALVGTNLSDVLWAKSVILTSPLVATLGLSLTIPLAMVSDFILKSKSYHALYFVGAIIIIVGFAVSSGASAHVESGDAEGVCLSSLPRDEEASTEQEVGATVQQTTENDKLVV
jgi:solute carrier family 35 protein F5